MLKKMLKSLAWKKLRREYRAQQRTPKIQNLKNAKSVTILWDPKCVKSIEVYGKLRKNLADNGLKVTGLAYVENNQQNEIIEKTVNTSILAEKEIGVWGQPKSAGILQIIKQPHDILIDLSLSKILGLQYALVHSVAAFKVGYSAEEENFYDFSIQSQKPVDVQFLCEQLKTYLQHFNQ